MEIKMDQVIRIELLSYTSFDKAELVNAMYKGTPIWIELDDDSSRKGSIGQASPKGQDPNNRSHWKKLSARESMYGVDEIDLYFPDKPKPITVNFQKKKGLVWLKNYTGPGVFNFEKKDSKPKHQPLDLMGHPITKGNMIVYTFPKIGVLRYGFVESVSESGLTIEVSTIDLENATLTTTKPWHASKKTDRISTTVSYTNNGRCEQVTVIRGDLLTELMTLRLSMS
jgi:hypothetical protein